MRKARRINKSYNKNQQQRNDVVVDMFCGSCVVPKCCDEIKRKCIAGDVDDKYFP